LVKRHLAAEVDATTLERITLLVTGIIKAKSAAPAQVAKALAQIGLSQASADSIERRIRRIENDPEVTASLCFHPLARHYLLWTQPRELILILDPTTQDDRVVMVSAAVWYRGRALPLAWAIWPGNTPLTEDRFWARIAALLEVVAGLLPLGVRVTWLADRAFGTPAFTDLIANHDWHYVVRVQHQTVCRDKCGVERAVSRLVPYRGRRAKLCGQAFKKRGWRAVSVVAYWGRRHKEPLVVVSDLRPAWWLLSLYRRRYPIEALFRNYKSNGWCWEQGQVTDLKHIERLLVGMALATWITLFIGSQVAAEYLAQPPTGRRRTMPWAGKQSLFELGLQRLHAMMAGGRLVDCRWQLTDWDAPNWQDQIYQHHAHAYVFGVNRSSRSC
jgi:hypothetical protein